MEKIQVVWKAYYRQYIGVGDNTEGIVEGGVEEFSCWDAEAIENWLENKSVHYGEMGGRFRIMGFWHGEPDDLCNGNSVFQGSEVFYTNQKMTLKSLEEDKQMNKQMQEQIDDWHARNEPAYHQ